MHQAIAASPRLPLTMEQQRLATEYVPLAQAMARSFKETWPHMRDEFDSAASMALVEAAEGFDPERQVRFATFARIRIWGALRDAQRRQVALGFRCEPRHAPQIGSLPMEPEVAGNVVNAEPDPPVGRQLEEVDQVELWLRILPRRHALACRQIYLHGATHVEVARLLGCSQSRVAALHRQALFLLNRTFGVSTSATAPNLRTASV